MRTRAVPQKAGTRAADARSAALATPPSLFFRLLGRVRDIDSYVPVSVSLGAIGALLLVGGAATSLYRLISAYPDCLAVAMGLICLLGSALASHLGLIRFLPQSVQQALFRRTPFELMFDESEVTNLVRRWARVYLLCQDRSEHEIQTIVRGLDPEFLDKVFRRSVVHMLPPSVCQLLFPKDQLLRLGLGLEAYPAWQGGISRVSGVGSLLARCLAIPGHGRQQGSAPEDAAATVLSPAGIRELLRQKSREKRISAREPALTPVVRALVWTTASDSVARPVTQQGLQLACATAMVAATMWSGASLFFCTPMARRALQALIFQGNSCAGSEIKASRAAVVGSAISLLGAGASAAIAIHVKRYWLWMPPEKAAVVAFVEDELAGSTRGSTSQAIGQRCLTGNRHDVSEDRGLARAEPEIEESPENSSTEEMGPYR